MMATLMDIQKSQGHIWKMVRKQKPSTNSEETEVDRVEEAMSKTDKLPKIGSSAGRFHKGQTEKKSSSFIEKGIVLGDEVEEDSSEVEIKQIDEAEFRKPKTSSVSKISSSTGRAKANISGKTEDSGKRKSGSVSLKRKKFGGEWDNTNSIKNRTRSSMRNVKNSEEEKSNSPGREFSFKKRRCFTTDASDKINGVPQQNEETFTNIEVVHNANTEDGLKEGGDGKLENENSPKNSKDLSTQKDCEGAEGVNEVDFLEESHEDVERQKTILPSRLENVDCGHNNDAIPTPSNCDDETSSDSHRQNGHDEKLTSSDEIETVSLTINKQLPEENEIDEEPEPAPEPQTQNTLPLKYRLDNATELSDKTESQKEMEGLSDELNELGSVNCPKVGPSNRKEQNKAVSGANSMKRLNGGSNKASSNDSHVGGVSNRGKLQE